jgi:hypothetical protein
VVLRTRAFPGGITDSAGATAFLTLADDEIVSVDLGTGDVRWRRADAGRALLVTDAGLLVVRRRQGRLELALLDPAGGEGEQNLGPLPVPGWASQEWDHGGGFVAVAEPRGRIPRVTWRATRRYHGGAGPSPELAAAAGTEASGVVEVDLVAGSLHAVPEVEAAAPEATVASGSTPAAGPFYTLDAKASTDGTTAIVLTASLEGAAEPVWETVLDRRVSRRPGPLRQ